MISYSVPQSIASYGAKKYREPSRRELVARRVLSVVAGLLLGAVNGVFGAGGGTLAVPALTFVLGMDERKAHATAIACVLPLCAMSVAIYSARASFDVAVVLPTVIGVLLGGIAGALLLKKLPAKWLNFIFYGLMLFAGIKTLAE